MNKTDKTITDPDPVDVKLAEIVDRLVAGRGELPGGADALVLTINDKAFALEVDAAEALVSGARELLDKMAAERRRRGS